MIKCNGRCETGISRVWECHNLVVMWEIDYLNVDV